MILRDVDFSTAMQDADEPSNGDGPPIVYTKELKTGNAGQWDDDGLRDDRGTESVVAVRMMRACEVRDT
jgi:hypothetical protein